MRRRLFLQSSRWRRQALAGVVVLSSSPTLPLPPPERPTTITAGATPGTWEVFGTCTVGALVTVFNEQTGEGVVVEDRALAGVYHVTIEGAECDLAWVKEDVESSRVTRTSFVLAARKPGDQPTTPLCH